MNEDITRIVAYLYRGEMRKSAADVAATRLGPVEACDVREFLSETSTAANAVFCFAWRGKTEDIV